MKKPIRNFIFTLITVLCILICLFTVASSLFINNNSRSLLGYKFYSVLSDSMSATDFKAGDLICSKVTDASTLQVGDIISFISYEEENKGSIITHKIAEINKDSNGDLTFKTYGTTTGEIDSNVVYEYDIQGKYEFAIPYVGYFFVFLKKPIGYVCCILIPFMIVIAMQASDSIKLYKQYKEEVNKEKNKNYNKKVEDMEKQIAQLQKQLEMQKKGETNE